MPNQNRLLVETAVLWGAGAWAQAPHGICVDKDEAVKKYVRK